MAKYNQKVTQGIYKRVVGAMSGLANIDVEIDAQVTPHWDPNARVVRMPLTISYADNDEEEFQLGRGITVHEASHVMFAPDIATNDKDLAEWFNVFVDCNNEWKTTQLWPHLAEPLAYKTKKLVEKRPKILKSDNPFVQVIMRCDKLANLKPEFPDNYNPDLKKFVEQVSNRFHHKNMAEANGEELIKFTNDVNKEWQKLCKNKEELCNNSGQKAVHKLMKELGEMIKKGADAEAIADKQQEIEEAQQSGSQWFEDEVNRQLIRETKGHGKNNYNKMSLDELKKMLAEANDKAGSVKAVGNSWGCDVINVGNIDTVRSGISGTNDKSFDGKSAYKQGKKVHSALKKKVNLQEDFEKRHRSGRLDLTEIRRQVGQMGRVYKETVFERENNFTRGGEWAIEVLCDCSGSMSGRKMKEAKQALATLAYALDGLPNVKYALTGFNYHGTPVEIQVKRFKDRKFDIRRLDSLRADDGNADGYNIRAASKRLLKYRNIKKVLVVISDGQPAYVNGIDDTKKSVEIAERYGIKVIGIGIEGCTEKALNEIYPTSYYFNNNDNLHKELTNLILQALGQREKTTLVKRRWER